MNPQSSPFRLPRVTPFGLGESVAEWATGLNQLDALYQQRPAGLSAHAFMRYTLDVLGIEYQVTKGSLENVPKNGATVVVANHPLGAIEGVMLAELLGHVRNDIKVLANHYLKRLPEISELFIAVDVFEGKEAIKANIKAMREAHQHLAEGGLLLIFPAGEVSTYQAASDSAEDVQAMPHRLIDNAWSRSVAKLVKRSQATTVPIFIDGHNSKTFYRAGTIHPMLRTLLLGRELLNKHNQTMSIAIGDAIPFSELKVLDRDQKIVNYLRLNTYLLSANNPLQSSDNTQPLINNPPPHESTTHESTAHESIAYESKAHGSVACESETEIVGEPVIAAIPSAVLQAEMDLLEPSCHLLTQGDIDVYYVRSAVIPMMMQEIGRVREISFRAVGEGTGFACDVDDYDPHYHQLIVWHNTRHELVGAYRMGLVDELVEKQGIDGLYSRSLFNYDEAFINQLGASIELGRSVVATPYQRSLSALLLLWKGIATFVSRHPQYTHLFGPVSISNDYSLVARHLMASTLTVHHYDNDKAALVNATTPLKGDGQAFWHTDMLSALGDVQLLSKVLSRLEQGRGLPVLLRQYLGLKGKLVCFNVDPAFNDALDGLIVVNLAQVPEKTLGKYMGREQAKAYLATHNIANQPPS